MTMTDERASAIQCQERAKLGMENGGEGAGGQRRGLVVRTRREPWPMEASSGSSDVLSCECMCEASG